MRSARIPILLATCFWMLWVSSASANGLISLNVDIPPGKWKGIRLKNVLKGATVAVQMESNGKLVVALMDSKTYRKFSETSRPLFLDQVEERLSFSVIIPPTDHYYVVLNNRSGQEPRAARITIRATRPGAGQKESGDKDIWK